MQATTRHGSKTRAKEEEPRMHQDAHDIGEQKSRPARHKTARREKA